jgi:hypothetical protein
LPTTRPLCAERSLASLLTFVPTSGELEVEIESVHHVVAGMRPLVVYSSAAGQPAKHAVCVCVSQYVMLVHACLRCIGWKLCR